VYQLAYSRAAAKTMAQLPAGTRRLIERKLTQLARAPREAVNVKRLKGHPHGAIACGSETGGSSIPARCAGGAG
jgi:mRNA-degrading endonuclease RelE of RelBE toxin-antitoxin system